MMKNFFLPLIISLSLISFPSRSQIDVTKYASDDLFSVKSVVSEKNIEKEEEYVEKTMFDIELEEVEKNLGEGNFEDALFLIENMIDQYKGIPDLHFKAGLIHYQKEKYEQAISQFNKALKIEPLYLEARYMIGSVLVDQGEHKEAKKIFKDLSKKGYLKAYGFYGLGWAFIDIGNYTRSYANFKKCIQEDPLMMDAYIPLIRYNLHYGYEEKAKKYVRRGLEANENWEEGLIIRGLLALYYDANIYQFEKDLERLVEIDPGNYHYHSMRGFLKMEMEEYNQAIDYFRQAFNIEIDPYRKGEFKFNSKLRKSEEIQRLLNYYAENPIADKKARGFFEKGVCKYIAGEEKAGIQFIDSSLVSQPTSVAYSFKAAMKKSMFYNSAKAIKLYKKAIELDSANWIAYSYRGTEYLAEKNVQAAYRDFNELVKLKPKLKEGYKNRGNTQLEMGYHQHAYKDFSTALAIDPTDNDLYYNRAISAMNMSYYENAENDLDRVISSNPDDGGAYYLKHLCEKVQGDTLGALALLDSASLKSKYKDSYHFELLKLATKMERESNRANAHNRLVKYNPWNYGHLFNRAKYFYEQKNYEKALKDLEKYLDYKKSSGEAYYYLAVCHEQLGDTKNSEKCYKKAKKYGYDATNP